LLRERREARGLSLQAVSSTTKIREHILAALEKGTYEILPAPVFVRGFLRTLARQLGLDPEELLSLYAASVPQTVAPSANGHNGHHGNGTSERESHPPPELKPHLKPAWTRPAWLSGNLLMSGLIVLLLLAGVAWGGEQMFKGLGQSQPLRALDQLKPTLEAIVLESTPTEVFALNPTPLPTAAPTAGPSIFAATPTPLTVQRRLEIRLEATARCWVKVDADGTEAFQGTLEPGAGKTFAAQSRILLKAGNAGGVNVFVNGSAQVPLGASGDVADRQWVLNDNGTVTASAPAATPAAK
jgi:transcriptional regulator with XRE-family HTH domain